jgi:hypothetical protein
MSKSNKEIGEALAYFHNTEDSLLARLKSFNKATGNKVVLPERLSLWRFWIADSVIYLNELRNFVEALEKQLKSN